MITKIPIHVQASKELSLLEQNRGIRLKALDGSFKKPNPFVSNAYNCDNFSGTKVIEGDSKTQFRIRPQTPKLDMILLQKARRKQLTKIEPIPVKQNQVKLSASKVQRKKIKI